MGRPEEPIDPLGPIADFASGLRALRDAADLSYKEMASLTYYCVSTLSTAASGKAMPTWEVTEAYVKTCNGDLDYWWEQWLAASDAWKRCTNGRS
ncbi:helix-turn-helix domain-containing protein [Nonomuraea phyllanthi]|uniref:helix-turn-helix domain-containing protein n=1 Tax=Nonomuraea phyllanthi TaxID=2219224 RepID=UPI001293916F|nr:helix-turn-helix transcriptional regulator [Nonomuraea phyllanthi]QFY05323.1 helix-turn-helix domain-containing protein [Nonomuraea phyllanthi]